MLEYLASPAPKSLWDNWPLLLIVGALLIVFMVMPIFTQKKNNKKYKEMVDKINIGDEVKTIGGVIGKIVDIKSKSETEKFMVIETGTGDSKSTMTFDMNAILNVITPAYVAEDDTTSDDTASNKKEDKAE
jgi:preprotein translocase subunit YajC